MNFIVILSYIIWMVFLGYAAERTNGKLYWLVVYPLLLLCAGTFSLAVFMTISLPHLPIIVFLITIIPCTVGWLLGKERKNA